MVARTTLLSTSCFASVCRVETLRGSEALTGPLTNPNGCAAALRRLWLTLRTIQRADNRANPAGAIFGQPRHDGRFGIRPGILPTLFPREQRAGAELGILTS
jgi:hypothetical protein